MLNNEQKRFIREKVERLGSIGRVKEFYKRKSLVCEYAYKAAERLYRKKK